MSVSDGVAHLCAVGVAASLLMSARAGAEVPPRAGAFFQKHCVDCHGPDTQEGKLDLTALKFDPATPENFARWVRVYDRVRTGEMPPADSPRPGGEDLSGFTAALNSSLTTAERERLAGSGRATVRRMNRHEYENTLRDLFQIPVLEIREFLPEDTTAHGFNKVGDALDVSRVQLARYLQAAEHAIRRSMAPTANRPEPTTARYYTWDQQGFNKGFQNQLIGPKRIYDHQGAAAPPRRRRGEAAPPPMPPDPNHDREKEAVGMQTSTYEPVEIQFSSFRAPATGRYRLRFAGFSYWITSDFRTVSRGRTVEPVTVYSDRTPALFRKLATYEVGPDDGVFEFETWLVGGETIRPDATRLVRRRPNGRNPLTEQDGMPGVAWKWMEVEGPLFDEWPPAGHELLFGDLPRMDIDPEAMSRFVVATETNRNLSAIGLRSYAPPPGVKITSTSPEQDAERLLRRFMKRVARRPFDELEIQRFVKIARQSMQDGDDFTEAMIGAYTAVLSSPAFVYFDEDPGPLSQRALAERLSYFLWNSQPDEELLRLADAGALRRPEVLRQQTERLLADRRSARFVSAFLDYWLDLRLIEQTSPDVELYPEYDLDDWLVESAQEETRSFFRELIDKNLSVTNLIDSSFAMLNHRLGVLYQIPVDGAAVRRVELPEGSVRGGLLTQAAVLKVTANGTTTSPVVRGAWVQTRLLGQPPPPPPAAVPAVEPDTRGATTIREQLAKHRSIDVCNACHRHIDPAGFALESFDVFGGFRERYRSLGEGEAVPVGYGHNGQRFDYKLAGKVDPSGELIDGQRFEEIRGLKACLLKNREQLARNMVQQLTVYATGAPVRFSDRPAIAAILKKTREDDDGLRSMIHEIIQSELFLNK